MQYHNHDGSDQGELNPRFGEHVNPRGSDVRSRDKWDGLEEGALQLAVDEVYEVGGRRCRPWAANGRACRIGEIMLIVDPDTIVPEDCLQDAAREMAECPTVAIIQHESDVMQVTHHYFENGIAYFTRQINKYILLACEW